MAYDNNDLKTKMNQGVPSYLGYVPGSNPTNGNEIVLESEELLEKYDVERDP